MVDAVGYVNAVAGAPSYNGRMLRQLNAVGFAGATAARPLGARSGVRPGTPSITVTATSTVWTCKPFAGLLDGQVAGEAGPYPFAFDAVATGPITVADASNPRIDILYVDVDDPSEDASSVPAVSRKYLAGVAAGSPVAPSAPAGCMTVAQINVPKSGGGSPTVTWVAPYCAAAGGTVYFNTKAEMEAWLTAPKGQRAHVLADGGEHVSNGAGAWASTSGVVCSLRKSGNQNLTTGSTALIWDVEVSDTAGMHSDTVNTTRIIAPVAGLYEVSASVYNNNTSGMGTLQARLNGTADIPGSLDRRTADISALPLRTVFPVAMAAGDYVEIMVSHASAAGNIAGGTAAGSATVTVKRLGPVT